LYQAPDKNIEYSILIDYIDGLPEEDDPSIFGMNIFAEKTLRSKRSDHLINSILLLEPQLTTTRFEYSNNIFY
jgi:hypothetical protein